LPPAVITIRKQLGFAPQQ